VRTYSRRNGNISQHGQILSVLALRSGRRLKALKNEQSNQTKSKGGARPGSGRKPKAIVTLRKATAEKVLASVDEVALWKVLLNHEEARVSLDALKYLTDRRDGKAAQSIDVNGEMRLTVVVDL
jgi:hypothetical protein